MPTKLIFMLLLQVFFMSTILSQSYNTAAGFRMGDDFGLSVTQRFSKNHTIEFSFSDGLFSDHTYVSLSVKQHKRILSRRFNYYTGGGYYGQKSPITTAVDDINSTNFHHGIMGVLGAEFTLSRINVALDYTPHYTFGQDFTGRRLGINSAFTVRYVLWKRESSMRKAVKKVFKKK
jgi:hypothetical protein